VVVVQYRSPSLTSWHGFRKALGPRVCGLYKQPTFVYVFYSLATSVSLPLTRRFDTLSQILPRPLLPLLQSSKTTTTTTKGRHHHRHQDHSPWSDLSPPSTHMGLSSRLLTLLTLLYHHQVGFVRCCRRHHPVLVLLVRQQTPCSGTSSCTSCLAPSWRDFSTAYPRPASSSGWITTDGEDDDTSGGGRFH
jgi:hypothetical protein